MDLIGKTVRWEVGSPRLGGHWYTATVISGYDDEFDGYDVKVLDPGNRPDLEVGDMLLALADRITVIDSEPVAEDEECE